MNDLFADQRLDGKVVVVTGSTQGLGAAIARRVARLGAAGIVVCGRDRERGVAVRDALQCESVLVTGDLAEPDDCRSIIRACDERFGRLDGLVNAAGLSTRGATLPYFYLERYIPSYVREWEAFVDAVSTGSTPPVTVADARAPLVIGLAAWRSLREGRPVRVEEVTA